MGPSLAPWLWVFGLTVMFGPVMLYVRETDGNQDDGDFVRWLMGKPLDFHFKMRAMVTSGLGLVGLATILGTVR